MAEMSTLHDLFLDELRDVYNAEKQITKALPKMIKAATSQSLRSAFEAHLEETQDQIERLEKVFQSLDERVRGKQCEGMAGIIEEGRTVLEEDMDDVTRDAALIAAAQRVEHYEMAAYGTLVEWARTMGHGEAAELLQETLDEEKAADQKLTEVAESGINQDAAEAAHGPGEKEEEEEPRGRATAPVRTSRSMSTPRR